ncbi:epoxide hydrolase [Microtetraspora sp. NBRC 13810]|uniref:alpha/beta fold hydrolase n=1 Tax=Microtetraspora sp. NBRC 13810 TaxID=3030990 RepID=UPI00249F9AEA|nr:alpha/beta hydrolase [Microtetraspora sp. NBRC 13810]GLW09368.1 epoxide hydrolase [Microtetraspora sp. NBRC 13810]
MTPAGTWGRRVVRVAASAALAVVMLATAAAASPGEGARVDGLPGFTQGNVPVEGGGIHYVKGGSGPALLLLHGWPETWETWRGVMPKLAREHTVIALDLPGLGASSIPAGGYDKVTTAHRVRQAVHALGHTRVGIIGHDLGVLVAYPYARDFPAEVSRLAVIESPLPGFGLEDLYGVAFHFRFNASPAPIPERIIDNEDVSTYLGAVFEYSHRKDAIRRDTYYRAYASPARRTAGYEYYRALAADAADNQAGAARRLAMPVAAIGGQYSFGPGVAGSFSRVADDVRTVVAPDAGHFVPEENPGFLTGCALLFFGPAGTPPGPGLGDCAP